MVSRIDLFNTIEIDNVETLNVNTGTINELTSETINASSSNITSGTFQTLYSGTMSSENCNINRCDIHSNLNFHSNSNISKGGADGGFIINLQNKSGDIALLSDIHIS